MPTFVRLPRFDADWRRLHDDQRARFRAAVAGFVEDLRNGDGFRPGLRVKRVQGTDDVWEMTFAPDGRATWQYGDEVVAGEAHVVWRRIGTPEVLRRP
jgi:hypothetical protein